MLWTFLVVGVALAALVVARWVAPAVKREYARFALDMHQSKCPGCAPLGLCEYGERLRQAAYGDIT